MKEWADETAENAVKLLKDGPVGLVENIGQGMMDEIQTPEGIASVSGGIVGTLAGGYAGSKVKPAIKANKGKKLGGNSEPEDIPQVRKNVIQGREYEKQEFAKFAQQYDEAVEQIIIKTAERTKTRVDAIGIDKETGEIVIKEFKSSKTAPLTKNQRKGFPQLKSGGGRVVGKGKGEFIGGYQIPKGIEVEIIRPPK